MRTLYLECAMGAAGDMLTAALYELLPDKAAFLEKLNNLGFASLGLPNVVFTPEHSEKCGIGGTHMRVTVDGMEEDEHLHEHTHEHHHEHEHTHEHTHGQEHTHTHSHSSLGDVTHIIGHLPVSARVKEHAGAVYRLIAEAESRVHGRPIDQVHFHEVGTMDAIADVTAVCLAIEALAPDRILASPVHVGSGRVRCAHGVLPVPAPATELLLRGVPTYGGEVEGELCTPTGAALLKHFADSFGPRPALAVTAAGYGMGTKDFVNSRGVGVANCVRAFLCEEEHGADEVSELECNLDDMTPEAIAFACETLLAAGALDVFTSPITMKKSRPAVKLSVLCRPAEAAQFAGLILRHTTTLGVRESVKRRYVLDRQMTVANTKYGAVRVKLAGGKAKPESDDVAACARQHGVTFAEVSQAALDALK